MLGSRSFLKLVAIRGPGLQGTLVRSLAVSAPKRRKARSHANHILRSPYPDVQIPDVSIPQYVWRNVNQWPDLTAVQCGVSGRSYSYKEARDMSRRIAVSLAGLGLRPGQVVAMVMPNTAEYTLIILGALEAGLIISPANSLYTVDEVVNQLKDSGSVAVITTPNKLPQILEAKSNLSLYNRHQSETLKVIVAPGIEEISKEVTIDGAISLNQLVEEVKDTQDLEANMWSEVSAQDLAVLPYSSGTTGLPKGVCLSHSNIVSNLTQMNHPAIVDMKPSFEGVQDVVPLLLPIYHIYGLVVLALQGLFNGVKLITLPKFEEKSFLNVLTEHKATMLYVAPPLIIYLGNSPNVTQEHLKTLRLTMSGAAPVGETDILRCMAKSPKTCVYKQGYGLTECSPGVFVHGHEGNYSYGSVGNIVPNTEVKIVDATTGESLPPNKSGEICVRGPQVMKGYLNNPEATEEALDKDGWFYTGDIGIYDEKKHFYVLDRLKELIKVKGFQVAPSELEEVLRSHPEVADAGVIGVPDRKKGEKPVGFITLRKGSKASDKDFKDFLEEKVAPFKQIDEFIYTEGIPKSAAGKILRKELLKMYQKQGSR